MMLTKVLFPIAAVALTAITAGLTEPRSTSGGVTSTVCTVPATPGGGDSVSRAYLHSFNLPADGVALSGFSPVSYFEGRTERGSALFAVEHRGVTYHLTSARQVEAFKKSPPRFEPAFGGWCAFGMSVQDKFPVDPTNFKIVDGRLLLFLKNANIDARELWNAKDKEQVLAQANAHWKKVQG